MRLVVTSISASLMPPTWVVVSGNLLCLFCRSSDGHLYIDQEASLESEDTEAAGLNPDSIVQSDTATKRQALQAKAMDQWR